MGGDKVGARHLQQERLRLQARASGVLAWSQTFSRTMVLVDGLGSPWYVGLSREQVSIPAPCMKVLWGKPMKQQGEPTNPSPHQGVISAKLPLTFPLRAGQGREVEGPQPRGVRG